MLEPNDVNVAHSLETVGLALKRKGDLKSAEIVFRRAIAICESAGDVSANVSYVETSGDRVTVLFAPALPDQDACTVELDCWASVCVRSCEGDLNCNGATTVSDSLEAKIRFGQTVTDANCEWDFDLSGSITTSDALQVKVRFGNAAPVCP